jgi:uncharacterized protein DUF559/transcriptional regulator with AbiEi antitoxin domain of type IV toxin-antitoxin system
VRSPVIPEEAVEYGLFSWRQAREAGYRTAAIELRLRRGEWVRRGRGVLAAADHVEQPHDQLLLAVLRSGPLAVASHLSAAEIHGWELLQEPDEPQVIVPRRQRKAAPGGVQLRRQDLSDADVTAVGVLPLTVPVRTAVDVGGTGDQLAATVALDSALRLGQVTMAAVRAELRSRRFFPGHRRAAEVLGLSDSGSGSVPETVARLLFRRTGLPVPCPQYEISLGDGRVARADFAWPEHHLIVEIDGFAWHSSRDAVQRDYRRERRLKLAGWTVLRYTADEVTNAPEAMLAEVAEVLGC